MTDEPHSSDVSLSLPALERIETVCLAFEAVWKQGHKPQIEEYLGTVQGPERSHLFRELLLLELDYLKNSGAHLTLEEYLARFPQDSQLVSDVFKQLSTDAAVCETNPSSSVPVTRQRNLPCQFGDYELLDVLGEGGMGIVYRARQRTPDRVVALKIIRPDRLAGLASERREQALERFRAETQAAASLEHEHIVPVYEVGQVEGQPFFSMRYIEGRGLEEVLRDGPLAGRDAAALLESVARALHYAHGRDIVHRDMKPRNILLDSECKPYVADFGLAKSFAAAQELTQTTETIGTPAYMSPEQARGLTGVDRRTDVYSLGATLYELLTGRPPFRAATVVETQRQVMENEPLSPRKLNPAIDRDLETICLKCLEKAPDRRYESAEQLADELQRFRRHEPILARPLSAFGRSVKWCRRKPWTAAALALLCIVAVVGPVAALLQHRLATRNARLAEELKQSNEDLRMSYETTRQQKEDLRHHLLNSDLRQMEDLMANSNLRVARLLLERHIPQSGESDFRSFAWDYWWGQSHQEDLSLPIGSGGYLAVLSPNGKLLATLGYGQQIVLVDLATCRPYRPRLGPQEVAALMFANAMAFAGDHKLSVFSCPQSLSSLPATPSNTATSLRPQVVSWTIEQDESGSYDLRLDKRMVLDIDELMPPGQQASTLSRSVPGNARITGITSTGAAAVDPENSLAAAVVSVRKFTSGTPYMRDAVAVWDSESGKLVEMLDIPVPPPDILSARLAVGGNWLVLGHGRGTVHVWRRSAGGPSESYACFRPWDGKSVDNSKGILFLSLLGERNELAVADRQACVSLIDLANKSEKALYDGKSKAITCVAFQEDRTPVIANDDHTITLRDCRSESGISSPWLVYQGHESGITWVGYSPSCKALFSLGRDNMLKRWPLPAERPPSVLKAHAVSPDFRWMVTDTVRRTSEVNKVGVHVVGEEWRLQLRDVKTGANTGKIFGQAGPSGAKTPDEAHFLPRGRVLVSYELGTLLQIWDPQTGEKEFEYRKGGRERILRIAESESEGLIVLAYGANVFLMDVNTWNTVASIPAKYVSDVCVTSQSELLIAETSNHISRWLLTGKPKQLERLEMPAAAQLRWWFSPDGQQVLSTGRDGEMQLWDLGTRRVVQTFLGHSYWIQSVAFHPNGKVLASAGRTIKLWDLATGSETLDLACGARSLHFSSDGQTLVGQGEPTRLWHAANRADAARSVSSSGGVDVASVRAR